MSDVSDENTFTDEEKFEHFFRVYLPLSGRFEVDPRLVGYKQVFDYYKLHANNIISSIANYPELLQAPPKIYLDYTGHPGMNACAAKYPDGTYAVAINSGVIFILFDLFHRIMSDPLEFSDVGDPTMETSSDFKLSRYHFDFTALLDEYKGRGLEYKSPIPKDPIRKRFAKLMLDFAMDYLILHEINHILNGHVDYVGSVNDNMTLEEVEQVYFLKFSILDKQTLEMDADCLAVTKGFAHIVDRFQHPEKVNEELRLFYTDFPRLCYYWSYAVTSLTKLMTNHSKYGPDYDMPGTSHPHPIIRHLQLISTLDRYLEVYHPQYMSDQVRHETAKTISGVELTYRNLTTTKVEGKYIAEMVNLGREFNKMILPNWNLIRPKLLEYTYIKLVPPNNEND